MKILSIAVPCYNSEAYMEKCIDSLLVGGEEVEILIVDDGSKDGTTEIAEQCCCPLRFRSARDRSHQILRIPDKPPAGQA